MITELHSRVYSEERNKTVDRFIKDHNKYDHPKYVDYNLSALITLIRELSSKTKL